MIYRALEILWGHNRKSHTRFRLVPKSTTWYDLERLIYTLLQKRCVFRSPPQKFEWNRPMLTAAKICSPVTLFSGDISLIQIFAEVPWGEGVERHSGAFLHNSGVIDNGNFQRSHWLFLRKLQTQIHTVSGAHLWQGVYFRAIGL